ncbi:MAG TPA: adenylate/guanylate cyclase domain-containing protein, partial [Actinomycetota bacterium]|nr:adenylate/guanylate cyclase domain-containing protein [Actinomycetota bacterium]
MRTCPTCGEENPDRARFCLACGADLDHAAAAPAASEERKVVSVLFVDLVGFTQASDAADPEDVRARLRPYHAALKREIERFGGTVEKFIGDAVMAVFGAPVAHEDDAERAVRAALRILDAIPELNEEHPGLDLAVRAAVNTGEAVVSLGARPERGEGIVAGDVVNTASRLQGAAPVGGVVVGEITHRATHDVFAYEELEPVAVKGKQEPVPLWRAIEARGRFGVDVERPRTPFVGREEDLVLLQQTLLRSIRDPSVQLVTVVGEPGVGKTRLVAEFQAWVDDLPDIVTWRQGRCLPYGDGVTFWALGEIVKALAGILESDGPTEAAAKLSRCVDGLAEDADREWLRARLAPLIGLEDTGSTDRSESFAAWRTFLELVAASGPLTLVLEDLHWADPAMLEFVDELVEWSSGVPLTVVCTARPELHELHPGWGGGKRNSVTLSLTP